MPPRTRGTKGAKILKENVVAVDKTKSKTIGKVMKPPRKALADKTNSASDDNTSVEVKKKVDPNHAVATGIENIARPRRERRLPTRYVENTVLNNLSNSTIQPDETDAECKSTKHKTPVKANTSVESSFKTPQKSLENSLVANRPKRICRLPSKFDDHSVSPSKFIPVQPCHASTPILENKSLKGTVNDKVSKELRVVVTKIVPNRKVPQKRPIEESPELHADTNNNPKRRILRQKTTESKITSPKDITSPRKAKKLPKKVAEKNFSFRVLEDKKKSSQNGGNDLDIYEFTYDPNEEPPPAKKKRKKAVKKKPAQPKKVVFKNNYDHNVATALEALKNVVSKKPDVPKPVKAAEVTVSTRVQAKDNINKQNTVQKIPQSSNQVAKQVVQNVKQRLPENTAQVTQEKAQNGTMITPEVTSKPANVTSNIGEQNYNSVRVEDIAADFEIDDYNDINYSPVNSPQRPKSPLPDNQTLERSVHNNDPLNLRGELSFFDDNPVASSSMNMSVRNPQASPWRVEFGNLPIKWHANTYVKPNMTPAVESSFINSENNKKKHVYTNMIGHEDSMPEVVPNQSNLKQTSIMSFIREVVERSAHKKKRGRSVTPTKANNLFDDLSKGPSNGNDITPKKAAKNDVKSNKISNENMSNSSADSIQDKENSTSKENNKKKAKTSKDKDGTFFGFDESEDQENMSPVKVNNPRVRALRPRSKAVLQEINAMSGPMRALPLAAKSKIAASSDAVNKVYEELKSAADAPVFPEKTSMQKTREVTNIPEVTFDVDMNEDSHSVHLFEDIEVVHHLKPTRKSYGKAKKVTFRQHSTSSETQDHEQDRVSSEEDDLADLTFTMPSFEPQKKAKKKKMTKKQKMSKKEQQALEEWAAGFNSMCEDIEDVPLIVE